MKRILALLLLAPGCAWVTGKDEAEQVDRDGDGLDWQEDCDDEDAAIGAAPTWYEDADGDGHGDPKRAVESCGQPPGTVAAGDDCDDARDDVYPHADETWYDGVAQDCAGDATDDDADGDGHGSVATGGDDCDDDDASVNPDATEGAYDGVDQDCDGQDADDLDGDGYVGKAAGGPDCDDDDDDVHPGADETWYDGEDSDCDGADDDDADGDGEVAVAAGGEDCDDSDDSVNSSAEEICDDGVDNDCDGEATCGTSGDDSLSSAEATLRGVTKGDLAGASLTLIGDWDGDGAGALVVGAPAMDGASSNEGAVCVVSGSVGGMVDLSASDAILYGEAGADAAGTSLSGADGDGDGYDDLLVGAPGRDSGGTNAGAAYIAAGPVAGTGSLDAAGTVLAGDEAGDQAGFRVAYGDINGDGYADAVIGAPYADGAATDQGSVYIVAGPPTSDFLLSYASSVWSGNKASDWVGSSVAIAGDVNADGLGDLMFGSYQHDGAGSSRGAAWLVHGPGDENTSVDDADASLLGEEDSDYAGYSLSGAGDVNGDGYSDVLVGAPYHGDAPLEGAAYVVLGPVRGAFDLFNSEATLLGAAAGDSAGHAVASAGDPNGDGYADVLVGGPYADLDTSTTASGTAWLVHGPPSGLMSLTDADASRTGEDVSNYAGAALAGGTDVNGDGTDDLAVGAYGWDGAHGAAYLLLGGGL